MIATKNIAHESRIFLRKQSCVGLRALKENFIKLKNKKIYLPIWCLGIFFENFRAFYRKKTLKLLDEKF